MPTTVVNLRRAPYDAYIGRAGHGKDGTFGNPFRLESQLSRHEVIAQFRAYFLDRVAKDAEFRRKVLALRGKRLGCFCKPAPCHGDVIAEWVDAQILSEGT
jgi:hypothetical protein